jgi:protein TonB
VILHAVIGMEGNPLQLRVMSNQIDPELSRAAVEAVSQWRYRPTLLNGEPIEVDTTIMVNFTLAE